MQDNTQKDDTIRLLITGDTQRCYNEVTTMVKKINSMPDIDFVAIAGDLSEFGVLQEMEWVAKELDKMDAPYVAVIGNHDLVNKGASVFRKMYGDLNYSFVYRGIKFICHDTNGREYKFNGTVPDIGWLTKALQPQDGVNGYVAMWLFHMCPTQFRGLRSQTDDSIPYAFQNSDILGLLYHTS